MGRNEEFIKLVDSHETTLHVSILFMRYDIETLAIEDLKYAEKMFCLYKEKDDNFQMYIDMVRTEISRRRISRKDNIAIGISIISLIISLASIFSER